MSAIVHISANGIIQLPPEILALVQPGTAYEIHAESERVVMEPVEKHQPFWKTATPAERAEQFRRWADSHQGSPGLPDEKFGRDFIYD